MNGQNEQNPVELKKNPLSPGGSNFGHFLCPLNIWVIWNFFGPLICLLSCQLNLQLFVRRISLNFGRLSGICLQRFPDGWHVKDRLLIN